MRIAVLFLAVLLLGPTAHAATLKDRDAAVALADQVMAQVAAGKLREGFAIAQPYTVVPAAEFEAMVGQTELQMPTMLSRFGKSIGHERLSTVPAGDSLLQVVEIQRFEKHATVWRFIFYRGSDGWILNSFKFVDDVSTAF